MKHSKLEVAVGQFKDPRRAWDAVSALKNAGFDPEDISVFTPADTQQRADTSLEKHSEANGRDGRGLVAGAVLGGLGGWLAGVRALAIPTVGPFIAAGSVALGAGIGTIAGGALGLGVPRDEFSFHLGKGRRGRALVLVRAGSRLDDATRIMRDYGASSVEHARESAANGVAGGVP
jgi:hypothetical protein